MNNMSLGNLNGLQIINLLENPKTVVDQGQGVFGPRTVKIITQDGEELIFTFDNLISEIGKNKDVSESEMRECFSKIKKLEEGSRTYFKKISLINRYFRNNSMVEIIRNFEPQTKVKELEGKIRQVGRVIESANEGIERYDTRVQAFKATMAGLQRRLAAVRNDSEKVSTPELLKLAKIIEKDIEKVDYSIAFYQKLLDYNTNVKLNNEKKLFSLEDDLNRELTSQV